MADPNPKKKILSAQKSLGEQALDNPQHSTSQDDFVPNQYRPLKKLKKRVPFNRNLTSTIVNAVESLNKPQTETTQASSPSIYEPLPQPEVAFENPPPTKKIEDYQLQLFEVMHGIVVHDLNAQVDALTFENDMLKSHIDNAGVSSAISSSQVTPQPQSEPQASDDSAFENIPVSQELLESYHFVPKLESMLESAELSLNTLEDVIRKRLATSNRRSSASGMTFGYDRDPKNAEFIHQQKVDILTRYVNASKNMIHLVESSPITSTHILDFLDEIYALAEQTYDINVKANTPTNEGPIVNLLELTKERMLRFLENHVVNPKEINKKL